MGLHVHINGTAVSQALQTAPTQLNGAIRLSLMRSAVYAQGMFIRNMPRGTTGGLQRSVTYHFSGDKHVEIEPTANQADYVEFGTRPHMPPVDSLRPWAQSKGLNPWAVARGIAKHGTRKQPYLDKTEATVIPYIKQDMSATMDKTIGDIL